MAASRWLEGAQIERVEGITQPHLWGTEDKYGMRLPSDWEGPTAEESTKVLEEGERVKKAELRKEALIQLALKRKTEREKIEEAFNKKFGDPNKIDSMAKTKEIMGTEDRRIKEMLGFNSSTRPQDMSPRARVNYINLRVQREEQIYERLENKKTQLKAMKDQVLGRYDTIQAKKADREWEIGKIQLEAALKARATALKEADYSWKSFSEFSGWIEKHVNDIFIKQRGGDFDGLEEDEVEELSYMLKGLKKYISNREAQMPGWWKGTAGHDPMVEILPMMDQLLIDYRAWKNRK